MLCHGLRGPCTAKDFDCDVDDVEYFCNLHDMTSIAIYVEFLCCSKLHIPPTYSGTDNYVTIKTEDTNEKNK